MASSNSLALVRAPRMSTSFLVITSVGRGVSFLGQPVRVIRPAFDTRSRAERTAGLAPEHSITSSAMRPPVYSETLAAVSSLPELTVYRTPSFLAASSRSSTRSIMIGWAPYAMAATAARMPMGPAPMIATCSPAFNPPLWIP